MLICLKGVFIILSCDEYYGVTRYFTTSLILKLKTCFLNNLIIVAILITRL